MNFIKKIILAGLLGGSLLFGKEAKAQETPSLEETVSESTAMIDFCNPLDNFDANSNLWFSANQVVRKISDNWEDKSREEDVLGRCGRTLSNFYFSSISQFYAHETAHNIIDREYGERHGLTLDFSNWINPWALPIPEYVQHPAQNWESIFSEEDIFDSCTLGLNTDEHNSKKYWKDIILSNNSHPLDAFSYLVSKLYDTRYLLNCGLEDKRGDKTGLSMPELIDYLKQMNNGRVRDIDFYTLYLYNKGIDLSKEKYLWQTLISDLLSWQTIESFGSVAKYIKSGERDYKPFTFNIWNLEVTPPLINLYLTQEGSFFDATCFVNPHKKYPFEVSLGLDDDWVGESDLDCLRLGGQVYNLGFKKLRFNPFAYLNMTKSLDYKGLSLGTELNVSLGKKLDLRGRIEYNENDVINNVKSEEEGFRFSGGLEFRF